MVFMLEMGALFFVYKAVYLHHLKGVPAKAEIIPIEPGRVMLPRELDSIVLIG